MNKYHCILFKFYNILLIIKKLVKYSPIISFDSKFIKFVHFLASEVR